MKKKRSRILSFFLLIPILFALMVVWIVFNHLTPKTNPFMAIGEKAATNEIRTEFDQLQFPSEASYVKSVPYEACYTPTNFIFPRFPFRTHCIYKETRIYGVTGDLNKIAPQIEEQLATNKWIRKSWPVSEMFQNVTKDIAYPLHLVTYQKNDVSMTMEVIKSSDEINLIDIITQETYPFNSGYEGTYDWMPIYFYPRNPVYNFDPEQKALREITADYIMGISIQKRSY